MEETNKKGGLFIGPPKMSAENKKKRYTYTVTVYLLPSHSLRRSRRSCIVSALKTLQSTVEERPVGIYLYMTKIALSVDVISLTLKHPFFITSPFWALCHPPVDFEGKGIPSGVQPGGGKRVTLIYIATS